MLPVAVNFAAAGEKSMTVMLTGAEPVAEGASVSAAVIVTEYVPAVVGRPDSCPFRLSDRPGGNVPVSVQENVPEPPLALKLKPGYATPVMPAGGALALITTGA